MRPTKNGFRHESLQDSKSIQNILKAITKGIAKGTLTFDDDDGEIVLEPEGLLNLKVTARKEDAHNRLDIRISWQTEEKEVKQKPLNVGVTKEKK
ncbi:MAG: amphi-Trp domain-containing protein [Pseudomonadales bacterium]|nr:amphi-Trp domain-containing protein [Pseudomonadales bacterium]